MSEHAVWDLQAKAGMAELSHTGALVTIETALRTACEADVIPAVSTTHTSSPSAAPDASPRNRSGTR